MTANPFMHSIVTKYGEWLYRAILLGAVCAGLYLQNNYVPRKEFSDLQKDVIAIQTTLRVMAESNLVNNRQDTVIIDHETRLRALEQRRP